ncbi:hypothetical protein [Staphylococcus saprophyticus]|nr:hypothetical protein [Staphylococcus saprophyticus]
MKLKTNNTMGGIGFLIGCLARNRSEGGGGKIVKGNKIVGNIGNGI